MFVIRNKGNSQLLFRYASARHYRHIRREEIWIVQAASFLTELSPRGCAVEHCGSFSVPQSSVEVCLPEEGDRRLFKTPMGRDQSWYNLATPTKGDLVLLLRLQRAQEFRDFR